MKNLIFLAALVFSMFVIKTAKAQEPIATLEHDGTSKVFYGKSSFAEACSASVNGDQIYLSSGYFDAPKSIDKGVKITGAGHFPVEGKQTQIITGLNINNGADSLRLEGLFINGEVTFDKDNSINYVKIIRCSFTNASLNSSSIASKNYCSIEECFISGSLSFGSSIYSEGGNNFLLRNSIVSGNVNKIAANALIDGNIFLVNATYGITSTFYYVNYTIIRNNIILGKSYLFYNGYDVKGSNTIVKNLFVSPSPENVDKETNTTGVVRANIFVNQTGEVINYLHDYHLKNPATYIGTDGKQVGIYGGLAFKENGVPSNPAVVSKIVSQSTDTNGNLKVNISVKAQDN